MRIRDLVRVAALSLAVVCAGCTARIAPPIPTLAPTSAPLPAPAATITFSPAPTATSLPPPAATLAPDPTATPQPATPQPTTPTPAPTATPLACATAHGSVVQSQLHSAAMGRDERFRIYLPPCYAEQASRRYPVIYLLHGGEHNEEHWDDIGVDEAADALIGSGAIPPVLIVLPDGGQDFGPLGGSPPPFARFLHDGLIASVDASYRTLADRDHRALGGISYGAAWALLLAARYPDTFGVIGAHSPAIGSFNGIYPSAAALAKAGPRIYLDVGDRDGLRKPTADFDAALTKAGAAHEFHVFPGRHAEAYWHAHLADYLRYYTAEW